MGNRRHTFADGKNERRRSVRLADADARAPRQQLADLPDRKPHAVELQSLNGRSLTLTKILRFIDGRGELTDVGKPSLRSGRNRWNHKTTAALRGHPRGCPHESRCYGSLDITCDISCRRLRWICHPSFGLCSEAYGEQTLS